MLRAAPLPKEIDCSGRTVQGSRHAQNQDRYLIGHLGKTMLVSRSNTRFSDEARLCGPSQGHLLVVADGLGGHADGGLAAESAIEAIARQFLDTLPWFFGLDLDHAERLESELRSAVDRCHLAVADVAEPDRSWPAGTTLTAAYILWPRMYVVHVGDSRCYLIRGDRVRQLTADHAVAQSAPETRAAEATAARKLLTRALGLGLERPAPDFCRADLEVGDKVLLCTDGLAKGVRERRLRQVLVDTPRSDQAVEKLIAEATDRGSSDDVTAVVAAFKARRASAVTRDLERTASRTA